MEIKQEREEQLERERILRLGPDADVAAAYAALGVSTNDGGDSSIVEKGEKKKKKKKNKKKKK